jgi:hypothetical protein
MDSHAHVCSAWASGLGWCATADRGIRNFLEFIRI